MQFGDGHPDGCGPFQMEWPLCCCDVTFQLPQNASFNVILRSFCWLSSVLLAVVLSNQTSHRRTLAVMLDGQVWWVVVVRCADSVYTERRGSVALLMQLHFLLLVNSQQTAFAVVTKVSRPSGIGSGIGCSIGDTDTKPIPLVSARYRYRVLVSV